MPPKKEDPEKKPRTVVNETCGCGNRTNGCIIAIMVIIGITMAIFAGMGVAGFAMILSTDGQLRKTAVYSLYSSGALAIDNENVIHLPYDGETVFGRGQIQLNEQLERICITIHYSVFPDSGELDSFGLFGPTTRDEPNEVSVVAKIDFLFVDCPNNNVILNRGLASIEYSGCVRMDSVADKTLMTAIMTNPNSYYIDATYVASIDDVEGLYTQRAYLGDQSRVGSDLEKSEYAAFPHCKSSTGK